MDDAGSKLLVLPTKGNAAAEAAAAELGTPTATLSVSQSRGAAVMIGVMGRVRLEAGVLDTAYGHKRGFN